MERLRFLALICLPFLTLAGVQAGDKKTARAATGGLPAELAPLDSALVKFMTDRGVPAGTLAVMKQGKLVLQRGYGHADRDKTKTLGPDAPLRLASISKPITAAAILQLIREGKLTLDTQVFRYLDLLPPDGAIDPRLGDVTVEHLLKHKGGWDRQRGPYFDPMFQQQMVADALGEKIPVGAAGIIRFMVTQRLHDDPGAKSHYSNFGYCVLGRVIEKASGKSYVEYIRKDVLAPLGAGSIQLGRSLPADRAAREPFYADAGKGRSLFGARETVPAPDGTFYLESLDSHGGLIGSAPDMTRFMNAYRIDGQARPKDSRATGVFYGALPGTWTLMLYHGDVNLVVLLNQRSDPSGLPYDTLADVMRKAVDAVERWPAEQK